MNKLIKASVLGIGVCAAGAAGADVTFFASSNFEGHQFRADRPLPNFDAIGLKPRAQSAIVEGTSWEFCVNYNYSGCTVLAPGRYSDLGGLNGRIGSARPIVVAAVAAPPVTVAPLAVMPAGITLFEGENFGGRRMAADRAQGSFGTTGFDRLARSAIVEGGSWEVCADYDFSGSCTILSPGRYPLLDAWAGRISSVRPTSDNRMGMSSERLRSRASATLYSGPNLTGRAYVVGDGVNNLEGRFNDRASSLRVDRGYWIFCSDADFRGECRTFGPGEYPVLSPELDNRISSGRRISSEYPYAAGPVWR